MNRILGTIVLLAASSTVFGQSAGMLTFQGIVKDSEGAPVDGPVTLLFTIYGSETGPDPVTDGGPFTPAGGNPFMAANGAVATTFGPVPPSVFTGQALWLEMSVEGSPLPRIQMTAAPGTPVPGAGNSAIQVTPEGQVHVGENSIIIDGTSGSERIASTDALELHTGSGRVLRVTPEAESAATVGVFGSNILGGFQSNSVGADVIGATVAGGGANDHPNRVTDDFGSIGGGYGNVAGDDAGTTADGEFATVAGGKQNVASGSRSSVGGGFLNTASGMRATVGGGRTNTASGADSTVGGGNLNEVWDTGGTIGGGTANTAGSENGMNDATSATVGGGKENVASGLNSTVAGGRENDANGTNSTVGGGLTNTASGENSTVGGGLENTANGLSSTVGGGHGNETSADYATIGGGGPVSGEPSTSNRVFDHYGTVGGGGYNSAGSDNGDLDTESFSTVGGGGFNRANGYISTIGGGNTNLASGQESFIGGGFGNVASHDWSTVGGGYKNEALANYATIAGGGSSDPLDPLSNNRVYDDYGAIGGGGRNRAGSDDSDPQSAEFTTVSGGTYNTASSSYATVGGGGGNTANGSYATVGGGAGNTAGGAFSTIPGGFGNEAAGDVSLAAGQRARSLHDGTLVWADSTNEDFSSTGADQFLIRANGGVGIGTASPQAPLHVEEGSPGAVNAHSNSSLALARNASNYINLLAPDANETGILFGNPGTGNTAGGILFNSGSITNGLQLRTGGNNTRMIIESGGDIGIGTTSPDARMHIQTEGRVAKFDRLGFDGQLVAWARDDIVVGDVTVAGNIVSYNAFTGSHYAWCDDEPAAGTLLVLTGDNRRLREDGSGEIVYGVSPSSRANDPACLGASLIRTVVDERDPNGEVLLVSAVGNGELIVVDTGADIAPGDLLISSHVQGCAMRDDPQQFRTGHIVARAAEPVRWSAVQPDADGHRRARTSVLFESFMRGPVADIDAIETLRAENDRLLSLLVQVTRRLERLEEPLRGPGLTID